MYLYSNFSLTANPM